MLRKRGFNWEDGLVFLVIAISLFATFYVIDHYLAQYESAMTYLEAINLHIARVNWASPEQLHVLSHLKTRYERLTDELRLAIAAFR